MNCFQNFILKILGIPYKQGDCPKVQPDISVNAICPEECISDMDCPDDLKCCSDGCGYVCMKPGIIKTQ